MRKLWLLVSLAVAALVLTGCATTPGSGPSASSSTTKPAATSQPKRGGTISYPNRIFPANFDVHRKAGFSPFAGRLVFNNLVAYDATKSEVSPSNIVGDLAERWETSADGKTWTFFLQKGVKWHDGKPFTADDVVYSVEKMKDPKRSAVTDFFSALDKVERVDDHTVKMYLKTPSPSFFTQLASPYTLIQPKHLASADNRSSDFLVGTGPFKVKQLISGVSIEFQKNADYFKKGLPYLDGVTIRIMPDWSAQVDALATRRLDLLAPGFGFTAQEFLDQVRNQAKGVEMGFVRPVYGQVMWFNVKFEPFKDVRVRRALTLLIDRKQAVIAAAGGEDWGNYDHAFFSPTFGLPRDEIDRLTGWNKSANERIAEAKKLMADAGYASGFKLKMPVSKSVEVVPRSLYIADQYRRYLNIDSEVMSLDNADLYRLRDAGDFHLYSEGTLAYMGEPDEIMGLFRGGSPSNFGRYANVDSDKLWIEQSQTMDLARRQQITRDIERRMLSEAQAVAFAFTSFGNAWWPYVKDFVLPDTNYSSSIAFERVWLDK